MTDLQAQLAAAQAMLIQARRIAEQTRAPALSRPRRVGECTVRHGPAAGDLIEVSGNLKPGDEIVEHGTDEIRDGSDLRSTGR